MPVPTVYYVAPPPTPVYYYAPQVNYYAPQVMVRAASPYWGSYYAPY
jgi:hypothetical protein